MIRRLKAPVYQLSTAFAALLVLTGCPGDEFQTDLKDFEVCDRLPRLQPRITSMDVNLEPGKSRFIPMQGPQGLIGNDPESDTRVPKATAAFKLGGIASAKMDPSAHAHPPFSASASANGVEFSVEAVLPPTGKREVQNVSVQIFDKCEALRPGRALTINFRLISDPATRPATKEELAFQMRQPPEEKPKASTVAKSDPKTDPSTAVAAMPRLAHKDEPL